MVGNMIRVLRAPMTLLAVDEAGMSTVEYSIVSDYTAWSVRPHLRTSRSPGGKAASASGVPADQASCFHGCCGVVERC